MSEKERIKTEREIEDVRNRSAVQALLALRDQTLMSVLRDLPQDFPVKMDYPNAAAWMRGTPGRFGIKKQRALLEFLGYVDGHLDTARNHVWFPVVKDKPDPDRYAMIEQSVKSLFKELVNDAPYHRAYIKTKEGLALGMAVDFGGASVIFPATNATNASQIGIWLSTMERWHQQNTADIVASREDLEDFLAGRALLDFWGRQKKSDVPDQWVELVDRLTELDISPGQVWKWVESKINGSESS